MLCLAIAIGLLAAVAPISGEDISTAIRSEVIELHSLIESIETRLNATAKAKLDDKTSAIYTCWKLQLSNFKTEAANAYLPLFTLSSLASKSLQKINSMGDAEVEQLVDQLYAEGDGLIQKGYDLIGDYSKLVARIHQEVLNLNTTSCS